MNDNLDVQEWVRFAQMDYDAAKNMSVFLYFSTKNFQAVS